MKNIILANIGNRNLIYQGKAIISNSQGGKPEVSFRKRTFELNGQYDTIKDELNEQILSILLNDIGPESVEKLVLFASNNQIEGDRNDQDTIYEAIILKKMFSERLGLQVDVVEYTQNVTHNDELLRFYRNILRQYQNTNVPIIICDAGGTAQQKAALKIAAEYILDPSFFEVRYVMPSGKITTVDQVEYRKIIDEEQVIALVKHGQYSGAEYIYKSLEGGDSVVLSLLSFLTLRAELFYENAQAEITSDLKGLSPFFSNFKGGKALGNYQLLKSDMPARAFFALCEQIEIAQYRYLLGDWSRTVLSLSIFIESFVNEVIQRQGRFQLVGQYNNAAEQLLKHIKEASEHTDLLTYFGGDKDIRSGLPLHLKYLEKTGSETVRQFVKLFLPLNSRTNHSNGKRGLDCLRNKLAHSGKNVKEADLKAHIPDIETILKTIRLDIALPETNSYYTANQILVSLIRN